VLTKRATNQNASITGVASFHDQLITTDSITDRLSFYDLRKPELLINVCTFENPDSKRKGHTSLQLSENKIVCNNMSNCVVVHKVGSIADPPKVFEGHRSTFFAKAALQNGIVASGSQDSLVYLWSQNGKCA
jgi:WD40 repeat protein